MSTFESSVATQPLGTDGRVSSFFMGIFDIKSDQQNHTLKQQGLFPTYFLLIFHQKITETEGVVLTRFYQCLHNAFWMVEHTPKTTVVVAMLVGHFPHQTCFCKHRPTSG